MMEVLAVHEDKLADMDQQTAADLAELFRAMSDPSRLRI